MRPKGAARGIVGAGVDSQMRGSTLAHPRKRQHNERKRQHNEQSHHHNQEGQHSSPRLSG